MATLTAAELTTLRGLVGPGEPPTDADLDELYDTLGSVEAVAHHVLAARLSDTLSKPTKVVYDGDVTEDWSGNVAALQKQVAGLAAGLGSSPVTTGRLVRKGLRR